MDLSLQKSATASAASRLSPLARRASTRSNPRRDPTSARASSEDDSSSESESRVRVARATPGVEPPPFSSPPLGSRPPVSASHASSNVASSARTYSLVASTSPRSCAGSVASSSISHRGSVGLNRKYRAPGIIGRSVLRLSSTRSTLQHDSRTTFWRSFSRPPLSALDASRARRSNTPDPRLTTQSIGRSGQSFRASITPSIAGLLHVTAPSCHLSFPCW